MRRFVLSLVCFSAAGLISVAAIADHANKSARGNHAQLLEWYCTHQGTRCGGPSSERIEEHWEQREHAYEIAVGVLVAVGAGSAAYRFRRR